MKPGVDYIGISVIPIVHDGQGNYVVGLRTDQCRDEHNCWEPTGGGGLELAETTLDAVRREVAEELGATPFNIEYLGFREVFREHDGKQTHWISFDFKAEIDRAAVQIMEPEKCAELRWCTIDKIPLPQHSQFPLFLEKYKSQL